MKTTKYTFHLCLFTFAFFTATFAQLETKKENSKTSGSDKTTSQRNSTNGINGINGIQAVGDKIIIRNQSDTEILNITEESNSAASIYFYDKNDFFAPGKKLVNDGGNLYWGSDQLGVAGSAGGWTDAGSQIYNSTLTDRVGIGTNNPSSKLSVGGNGSALYSIFGSNSAANAVAIYGSGSGNAGKGVYGYSSAADGRGIVGQTTGYRGRAVYGVATSSSQSGINHYGGYFEAIGSQGTALYAEAINGQGIYSRAGYLAGYFTSDGNFSKTVEISNNAPNGTALLAVGYEAAIFGGKVQIVGSLKTEGPVDLGSGGTPFLEIREITGTNGNGVAPQLPVGWTGAKTRLLSLEMKFGTSDEWVSLGFYIDDCTGAIFSPGHGERAVSLVFTEPNGRGLNIFYPLCGDIFDNSPWRAVIMRMP